MATVFLGQNGYDLLKMVQTAQKYVVVLMLQICMLYYLSALFGKIDISAIILLLVFVC